MKRHGGHTVAQTCADKSRAGEDGDFRDKTDMLLRQKCRSDDHIGTLW